MSWNSPMSTMPSMAMNQERSWILFKYVNLRNNMMKKEVSLNASGMNLRLLINRSDRMLSVLDGFQPLERVSLSHPDLKILYRDSAIFISLLNHQHDVKFRIRMMNTSERLSVSEVISEFCTVTSYSQGNTSLNDSQSSDHLSQPFRMNYSQDSSSQPHSGLDSMISGGTMGSLPATMPPSSHFGYGGYPNNSSSLSQPATNNFSQSQTYREDTGRSRGAFSQKPFQSPVINSPLSQPPPTTLASALHSVMANEKKSMADNSTQTDAMDLCHNQAALKDMMKSFLQRKDFVQLIGAPPNPAFSSQCVIAAMKQTLMEDDDIRMAATSAAAATVDTFTTPFKSQGMHPLYTSTAYESSANPQPKLTRSALSQKNNN